VFSHNSKEGFGRGVLQPHPKKPCSTDLCARPDPKLQSKKCEPQMENNGFQEPPAK